MNPEVHKLIQEMEKHLPEIPINVHSPATHNLLSIQMSKLLVLLAEEQEKSAEKLERQTNTLINLTRWLFRLTWVLVILTVGLLIFTYFLVKHG